MGTRELVAATLSSLAVVGVFITSVLVWRGLGVDERPMTGQGMLHGTFLMLVFGWPPALLITLAAVAVSRRTLQELSGAKLLLGRAAVAALAGSLAVPLVTMAILGGRDETLRLMAIGVGGGVVGAVVYQLVRGQRRA